MVYLTLLHNMISCRLHLKAIALVQLLVVLLLAVPACCYEVEPDHEASSIGITAGMNDVDHNKCPCCPDENRSNSDSDVCSTCSYCNYYTPLIPAIAANYEPSVTPLIIPEQFTKLADVHIPIYVPPQNLA